MSRDFKHCNQCGREVPLDTGWYLRSSGKVAHPCKDCKRINNARNRVGKEDRLWELHIKRVYGLDKEEYFRMYLSQDEACATCKNKLPNKFRYLAVDHDHDTGRIRGLLCNTCNRVLGMIKDDPAIAIRMGEYLGS